MQSSIFKEYRRGEIYIVESAFTVFAPKFLLDPSGQPDLVEMGHTRHVKESDNISFLKNEAVLIVNCQVFRLPRHPRPLFDSITGHDVVVCGIQTLSPLSGFKSWLIYFENHLASKDRFHHWWRKVP